MVRLGPKLLISPGASSSSDCRSTSTLQNVASLSLADEVTNLN